MAFKSGKEWNGNKHGAPKKEFRRDDFTEQLFDESKDDLRAVKDRLFVHALNDKPWAIKLVCEYFFTKPKSRDDYVIDVNLVDEKMSSIPRDILENMRSTFVDTLSKYNNEDKGKQNDKSENNQETHNDTCAN